MHVPRPAALERIQIGCTKSWLGRAGGRTKKSPGLLLDIWRKISRGSGNDPTSTKKLRLGKPKTERTRAAVLVNRSRATGDRTTDGPCDVFWVLHTESERDQLSGTKRTCCTQTHTNRGSRRLICSYCGTVVRFHFCDCAVVVVVVKWFLLYCSPFSASRLRMLQVYYFLFFGGLIGRKLLRNLFGTKIIWWRECVQKIRTILYGKLRNF